MQVKGQETLIKELDRVFNIFEASNGQIRPHFFLTGASGSGKSLTIQQLCIDRKLNYMEINAAALTKEGTSGNSLSKAMAPAINFGNKLTICFVDEFDKLFISGNSNNSHAHESTVGVQNEFLKVLESQTASVFGDYGKYINVLVENILFVFAGAFNNEPDIDIDRLRDMGLKTEFLGRVNLVFNTKQLSLDDLFSIIDESELLTKYCGLFPKEDREQVSYLIKDAIKKNYDKNSIGARLINSLIHTYFIKGTLTEKEIQKISFQKTLEL